VVLNGIKWKLAILLAAHMPGIIISCLMTHKME